MGNTTKHNAEHNPQDHLIKIRQHANWILEHDFDLECVEELIETTYEMGQLMACYRKHMRSKADMNRFKQYCPLCWECIHCECVPEVKPVETKESDVPF